MLSFVAKETALSMAYWLSRIYFWWISTIFRIINVIIFTKKTTPPPSDQLLLVTATDAADMIRTREISSFQLIEAYIQRIQAVNGTINAMVEDNFENARRQARQIDAMLDELDPNDLPMLAETKPLLGVPFTVKDCIQVAGMHNTYGLAEIYRMREAGAIHLAVTNVSEVCMWWESVNAIYGRTRNAYDSRRLVGGSSGGEGALISAGGSLVGIGSDIGGSVRMPAFFNGVFGLKPTPGIVPLDGHMPPVDGYRAEMLCIGPICRYAGDLTLMLKVMGSPGAEHTLQLDRPVQMRQLRFFYMEGMQSAMVQSLSNEMRNALKKIKYDRVAIRIDLPLVNRGMEFWLASMDLEGAATFGQHLCDLKGNISVPKEWLKFFTGRSKHNLISLLMAMLDNNHPFSEQQTKWLLDQRDRLNREIRELLGNDGVLLFPSFPTVAPFHSFSNVTPANYAYVNIWNTLLLPVVTCPMGLDSKGIPLGVQAIATPGSDRLLIAIARDLEDGFGGWKPSGIP